MTDMIDMKEVAASVVRALSHVSASSGTAFVATATQYPNGTQCVVRIDRSPLGFSVSDDGYASASTEFMGLESSFTKVAGSLAARAGIAIERKAFVLNEISREQLPGAVLTIASTSVRAVDHAIQAARSLKIKRSRETFNARVKRAFGERAVFDATVRGATREWDFEAAIAGQHGFAGVISLVSPGHGAVASANMKLGDIRAMGSATKAIAALVDYDGTEAAFRSILASAADAVIAASADPVAYLKAAEPLSAGIH